MALAALLAASARLRKLPSRAPVVRHATRLMLAVSLATTTATILGPPDLTVYLTFCAILLTGAAVVIPTDAIYRLRLTGAMAMVGVGAAMFGHALELLSNRQAAGSSELALGFAGIVAGMALLAGHRFFLATAIMSAGMLAVGEGAMLLAHQ